MRIHAENFLPRKMPRAYYKPYHDAQVFEPGGDVISKLSLSPTLLSRHTWYQPEP